jgi:ribosomal protein S18 acetylase RimI-like enzyme
MIHYTDSLLAISPADLEGFFVGWPNPPSPSTHLQILKNSSAIVLAVDDSSGHVVGFVNALSDGVLMAYIPLLEVLPDHQGRGIARELVTRLLEKLGGLYGIDLLCDTDLQPFYEKFDMHRATGMMVRNYDNQSGKAGG